MELAGGRGTFAINAILATIAALIPFWFYNIGVKYALLQKVAYMFSSLAWDPVGINLLLSIPFVIFATRTLRRADSLRKSVRWLIVVLSVVCFIYVLQTIFMLTVWSINGFAP